MKIAIVILNYNGTNVVGDCLASVGKLKTTGFELITYVVDNASTDESVKLILERFPKVTLIKNEKNLGFSEGNNVGIRQALKNGADFVLLLNNDTVVDTNCVTALLEEAQKRPKGGIFGPKIYFAKGYEFHNDRYKESELGKVIWYAGGKIDWNTVLASHRGVDEVDRGQYDVAVKTSFVSGCASFIRKEVFEKVGFLDPKLFLYYEDLDFCKKAQAQGFELYYVPKAVLWHKNAHSSGGSGSDLQSYYITRNRLLLGMRYAPWKTKMALFQEASGYLIWGTLTQKQAVGDFLRKKFGRRDWTPRVINLLRGVSRDIGKTKLPPLPQLPVLYRSKKKSPDKKLK
ncbi:glycosyltransferase family 2 protein [Candidatus Microgenomates bacterium]|nr:MAG: glycosyltransferase family 2 protein [Candidatus Microgenomates bacterium]